MIGVYTLNLYFAYYDDKPSQIYMLIGQLIVILFVLHPLLYQIEMNAGNVLWDIAVVLVFGTVLTLVSMVFVYISDLHHELHTTNTENVKLLDGMHEGLLILSKSSN